MAATFVVTTARRLPVPCAGRTVVGQYAGRRTEQEWTSAGAAVK